MNKILITSIGRTGTVSLAHYLNDLAGVTCYHERERQDVGFLFLSQTSDYKTLTKAYLTRRDAQITKEQPEFYIEVNPYLRFANSDTLTQLGWSKIMLSRHPKSYLESVFTRRLFSPQDIMLDQLPNDSDPFAATWYDLSRFEKLCWYYNKVAQYMLKADCKVFKFEDIIKGETGLAQLTQAVGIPKEKISSYQLPKMNASASASLKARVKQLVVGKPYADTPLHWDQLTAQELDTYNTLCVPVAKELGYVL